MMKLPEIIVTEDGSHSLFSAELKEGYHSKFGAMNESRHIFIQAGLHKVPIKDRIHILEIGFGTGLNAWLTFLESIGKKTHVVYHAVEPFPLPSSIYSCLNFADFSGHKKAKDLFMSLHENDWNLEFEVAENFRLLKLKQKLEKTVPDHDFYDLVYFDAFSPEIQPELWTIAIFKKIFKAMKGNGILVTYSAKGVVRRNMIESGFEVERIPGPKGKREMLRAIKR